jgi:hypothetical protein
MLRAGSVLTLAVAAAVVLASCGTSGEPKRTLNAQSEAIRFFAPDTPFVALVDPTPNEQGDPAQTISSLADLTPVSAFARNDLGFVSQQGIPVSEFVPLLAGDPTLEKDATQIAVGVKPTGMPEEDTLAVVVTERPSAARKAVASAAEEANMSRSGSYDSAAVYSGDDASMAVRDGVILIAGTEQRIHDALDRRDANPDQQLDDHRVESVVDDGPSDAPLQAYMNVGELVRTDPGVGALVSGTDLGWLRDIGEADLAVKPGQPTEMSLDAKIDSGADVPLGEKPTRVELSEPSILAAAAGEFAPTSGFHAALVNLGPARLTLAATNDELRALLVTQR